MSDPTQKPRRAYVLDLKIQANTKEELIGALQSFRTELAMGKLSGHGVSGSPSFGWIYDLDIDETITKEAYFEAIDDYLERERQPRAARDGELVDALIRLYQIEMAAAAFNASPAYVLTADIPYVVGALDRERATQKAVVARMIEAARSNGEAPDGDAP